MNKALTKYEIASLRPVRYAVQGFARDDQFGDFLRFHENLKLLLFFGGDGL